MEFEVAAIRKSTAIGDFTVGEFSSKAMLSFGR